MSNDATQLQKDALGLLTTGAQIAVFLVGDLDAKDAKKFASEVRQLLDSLTARLNSTIGDKHAKTSHLY